MDSYLSEDYFRVSQCNETDGYGFQIHLAFPAVIISNMCKEQFRCSVAHGDYNTIDHRTSHGHVQD